MANTKKRHFGPKQSKIIKNRVDHLRYLKKHEYVPLKIMTKHASEMDYLRSINESIKQCLAATKELSDQIKGNMSLVMEEEARMSAQYIPPRAIGGYFPVEGDIFDRMAKDFERISKQGYTIGHGSLSSEPKTEIFCSNCGSTQEIPSQTDLHFTTTTTNCPQCYLENKMK